MLDYWRTLPSNTVTMDANEARRAILDQKVASEAAEDEVRKKDYARRLEDKDYQKKLLIQTLDARIVEAVKANGYYVSYQLRAYYYCWELGQEFMAHYKEKGFNVDIKSCYDHYDYDSYGPNTLTHYRRRKRD